MKYTRVDLNGSRSKINFSIIFKFFIIIPLAAILIGSGVSKYFIVPYLSKNITPVINNVVYNYSNKYYMLQVGVFSNNNNAEFLMNTLNDLGYNSVIIKTEDGFRVISDISEDKSYIEEVSGKIKECGFACIISEIDFNKLDLNNAKFNKEINSYMALINRIFSLQLKLKVNQNDDNLIKQLKTEVESLNTEFSVLSNINDENILMAFMEFHNGFTEQNSILMKDIKNKNVIHQTIASEAVKINKLTLTVNSYVNKAN